MKRLRQKIYILWHVHEERGHEDDAKLIGLYATKTDAERAKRKTAKLPGFIDHPDGFLVEGYEVGKDHWTEGFSTVFTETKKKKARTTGCCRG